MGLGKILQTTLDDEEIYPGKTLLNKPHLAGMTNQKKILNPQCEQDRRY